MELPKKLPDVHVAIIPHEYQRYDSSGDYFQLVMGAWQFRVSIMGDANFEFLILLHELVEWWWAQRQRVPNEVIDAFDQQFERERAEGKHGPDDEPGDDPACPVYRGHQIATAIERTAAELLGIDWQAYSNSFDALPEHPSVRPT